MYWTWYNILLIVASVLAAVGAVWSFASDVESWWFGLVIAGFCVFVITVNSMSHNDDVRDAAIEAELESIGYPVADVHRGDVTLQIGVCTVEAELKTVDSQHQLLVTRPNGEKVIYSLERSRLPSSACAS